MIVLTDWDKTLIERLRTTAAGGEDSVKLAYLAGLRVGIERSAKVCDKAWRDAVNARVEEQNAKDCASAIRDMLYEEEESWP